MAHIVHDYVHHVNGGCKACVFIANERGKHPQEKIGGEGGDRTLDPRLMSPLLYRLSYLAPKVRVLYQMPFANVN